MHAIGDATMSIDEIDIGAKQLAEEGKSLIREYAAAFHHLKKHCAKVST